MSEARKQYSTPTVITYGDLATLTRSVGLGLSPGLAGHVGRWYDPGAGGGLPSGEVCILPYPSPCGGVLS
jgi:hypothetical protein